VIPKSFGRPMMYDPLTIVKLYREKAHECRRRAARDAVEPSLRLQWERLADCYSGFADAEERYAAKHMGLPTHGERGSD
jgi:hypothetical protein